MSQYDFGTMNPATESGTALAAELNAWRTALNSLHKGVTRPTYAIAGLLWIKDATDPWSLYVFDGAQDILIGTINTTTNVFTPSFGALSGILRADGSGGVAAATAAQIVAAIGALAVANATNAATSAACSGTAATANNATAISDGAVSSAAKVAANILTLAKLARTGTAGKPLLSGGAGADFYVGDFPAHTPGLGEGQTWQDFTASRAVATNYTNSTGSPIAIAVRGNVNSSAALQMFVGGIEVDYFQGHSGSVIPGYVFGVVPPGAVYRVDVIATGITSWKEFRA